MSTTQTPPPPGADAGPRVSPEEARDLARLRRTVSGDPQGRHVAGVAGGIARHLDIDPLVVRVLLVVLVFFGGAGLLLYVAGWLLVPEDHHRHAIIRIDERSRNVVLWVVVGLSALAVLGDSLGRFHLPWPLVVIGLIVLWAATRKRVSEGWWESSHRGAASSSASSASDAPVEATAGGTAAASASSAPTASAPAGVDLTKPGTAAYSTGTGDVGSSGPSAYSAPDWTPSWTPRPADPRKTGPVLFWATLALVALGMGVLGVIDVAGADLPAAAYPALALGLIGAMLVVGAFVGRAGGLIALGLLAVVALVVAGVGDHVGPRRTLDEAPTSAAAVASSYHVGAGRITLDLTDVADPQDLAGRRIELSANLGKVEVVVPSGMGVHLQAQVHGPGDVDTFGQNRGGFGLVIDQVYAGSPTITVVADVKVGQIELRDPDGAVR